MAKVFQALRIEINKEVEALQEMLIGAKDLLKPGGRLVVITYHSIEDRIVKNFMKSGNFEGKVEKDFFGNSTSPFDMKKVIVPTDEEQERNPRSRSAKLRIAIKQETEQ
jgi:16S rRNA (cytosine1402-N4)-methyltransferase